MSRKICIEDGSLKLLFAEDSDRKLIYDMSVEDDEIILSMFTNRSDFHWDELRDEKSNFFGDTAGLSKYLLIESENEVVGVFCHDFHNALIPNMELHIWMKSREHTGKGIGSKVILLMLDYLVDKYNIQTFLMRPWIKNERAIHTYKKCGFEILTDFKLEVYFTQEEIAEYGNGAYPKDETVNMLLVL